MAMLTVNTLNRHHSTMNRQFGIEESKYGVTGDPLFTGREWVT